MIFHKLTHHNDAYDTERRIRSWELEGFIQVSILITFGVHHYNHSHLNMSEQLQLYWTLKINIKIKNKKIMFHRWVGCTSSDKSSDEYKASWQIGRLLSTLLQTAILGELNSDCGVTFCDLPESELQWLRKRQQSHYCAGLQGADWRKLGTQRCCVKYFAFENCVSTNWREL